MPGPRAPIGTLSQHAANAAGLVRDLVPKVFTRTTPNGGRKSSDPVERDSESDSDSESESSTDSDTSESDEAQRADTKDWAESIRAKTGASVLPVSAKPPQAGSRAAALPGTKAMSPRTNSDVKNPKASESSTSESENDSDSDSDSDNDSDEDGAKNRGDTANKAIKPESADSDSESSGDRERTAPSVKPVAKSKTVKKEPSASASETSSPSDSESSDEEPFAASPSPKPSSMKDSAPATKQSSASNEASSSESESESESEGEPEPPSKPKEKAAPINRTAPAKSPNPSGPVNGFAKSKEFVSESESSSEDEPDPKPKALEKHKEKNTVQPPREIVSQGFHLRKAEEDLDAEAVVRTFKKAKAEGKQIWYFTTPKSVPIEVVQKHTIPVDKVHAGRAIFSHEGAEYTGHFEEPVSHAIKVLIPGKTGNDYESLNQPVDRVLHITRVTRFGEEGDAQPSTSATSALVAHAGAPRPQPKGLKARYQPFGVTGGATSKLGMDASDGEDVEMAPAPPLLPSSAESPKKAAKKRKHGDVEKATSKTGGAASSTPDMKAKKPRVDSTKQTPVAPPLPPMGSAKLPTLPEPAPSSVTKKPKGKKKDPAPTTAMPTDTKKPIKVTPVPPPPVPGLKGP